MSLNSIVVTYPPQQIDHIVGITKFINFNLREDNSYSYLFCESM